MSTTLSTIGRSSDGPPIETVACRSIIAGVIGALLLPVGMCLGLHYPLFTMLFSLHCAALLWAAAAALAVIIALCRESSFGFLPSALIWIIFFSAAVLIGVVPVTARDALIHHLAVPKWWIQAGWIVPIEWHEWSSYPMLINLGYTGLLMYGLEALTSYYHLVFLLLSAAVVGGFVYSRAGDGTCGYLAALTLFTLPICLRIGASPLVDLGLAHYAAAALCLAVYWSEQRRSLWWALWPGSAIGLALSCKYNGLLAAVVFFLAFVMLARRCECSLGRIAAAVVVMAGAAAVIYAPWMARNYINQGNPFYPLLGNFSPAAHAALPGPAALPPLQHRMVYYGEGWLELLLLPLRMVLAGRDGDPRGFDGVLSPLLLLALVGVWRCRADPWRAFFGFYTTVVLVFSLFLTSARVRYLAPIFGSAAVLAAAGVVRLAALLPRGARRLVPLLYLAVLVAWSGVYAAGLIGRLGAWSYLVSRQSRADYLRAHLAEYPMIEYVNRSVPPDAGVYLLNTGNPFYYYDRRIRSGGHYSSKELIYWLQQSPDAAALAARFAEVKMDFLVVHTQRTTEVLQSALSAEKALVWNEFQAQRLAPVAVLGEYSLWRVVSPGLAGSAPRLNAS